MSTNFYDLVYNDPDPAHAGFRNQFVDTPIELSIHNQVRVRGNAGCGCGCRWAQTHRRVPANILCAKVRRSGVLRRHGQGVVCFALFGAAADAPAKESSFILEMHRNLFHCTPGFLNIWLEMFETALKKTDLGPRSAEIRDSLLRWSSGFGKAMINAPDGSAHPRANNKPQ